MNALFLLLWFLYCTGLLTWGFVTLPRENYQFLASVPLHRDASGRWSALNLTWYGVLTGVAVVSAVALFVALAGAYALDPRLVWATGALVLGMAVPSSRWIARLVERKAYTFTIGGAVFVGFLVAPVVVALLNATLGPRLHATLPVMPLLGAGATAYAFGEGLGRLGCISFGCCYGKPVDDLPRRWRPLFRRFHFIFHGSTRKIAYAGRLEGMPVVPVQAMTAVVFCGLGFGALALMLTGQSGAAMALAMVGTQGVRLASEFLRCDHRGVGRLTAYQWMAMNLAGVAAVMAAKIPAPVVTPRLELGLAALWSPEALLGGLVVFCLVFLFTGRSEVTHSTVRFAVHLDRI